ncbi:hypothetical protein AXG93_4846s1270 [Marchantia polymorpha subsp. ruderalis]|uniref:Uncharacterized protein n=1 Tax=Marchantia polymorpha subsp. ruderalis TaxID=1480154 RepID=A0A176VCY8_MARPO|nr:hypothetical protein AXG93_4846s1270 [Marchantia polymorpha subsp. ruderalis]
MTASAMISHQKELRFKDAVLHETSQKLAAAMEQVDNLEKQLAVLKTSVSVKKRPSFVEKQKLEADSDAVVACIEVRQEGWGDKTDSLFESNSASSEATSLLEEMSNLLKAKYKAFVQEVESKTFSEQESLSQMQQMLKSKDLELSELSKRMDEAASHMA